MKKRLRPLDTARNELAHESKRLDKVRGFVQDPLFKELVFSYWKDRYVEIAAEDCDSLKALHGRNRVMREIERFFTSLKLDYSYLHDLESRIELYEIDEEEIPDVEHGII